MNAEQWNALYPVGTLVFAYPGFRPEDDRNGRRLVTRSRTKAQMSASGDPVVWVDGEGSYICLTHVDPVSQSEWQSAKEAEETAAAVAAQGALPVPVGDQPQPLDDTRLAEIREHVATTRNWSLGNLAARDLLAEVERLKAERHTTNEALTDAAEALRVNRDRIAELEAELAKYVGQEPTVAEEMAYLSRSVQAVADLCDKAEQQALRWENPLPVPEWVGAIRQALELAPTPTEEAAS